MSGLFGANAVRSPLSDIPSFKSRSGAQLEATINAALGAHPYETAWLTLTSLRPITNQDGFSALADLSAMERSQADRVRMVLTAGADIGAVETVSHNPERYRVRSELREYLSLGLRQAVQDRCDRERSCAARTARLRRTGAASARAAEIVLHTLEPIRETEGFTSMVTLTEISKDYESRVVRRVMNAGAAVKAVAPDVKIDDRYYIRPALYETLLTIRATALESAALRLRSRLASRAFRNARHSTAAFFATRSQNFRSGKGAFRRSRGSANSRRCPASSRCRKRRSSASLHIIAKRFSKRFICAPTSSTNA